MNNNLDKISVYEMQIALACISDIGRVRKSNQDSFIAVDLSMNQTIAQSGEMAASPVGQKGWFLAVADGMGGAKAGDIASRMAMEELTKDLLRDPDANSNVTRFCDTIKATNHEIHKFGMSDPDYNGMGATLTAAIIHYGQALIAQVGDSRAYLIRNNDIRQVTRDQSLVQSLIDAGQISEKDAENFRFKNIILQALGVSEEIEPNMGIVKLNKGDRLLLCSDGLSNKVGNVDMHDIVSSSEDLGTACKRLIDMANERGGEDNITVILAQFDGADLPSSGSDTMSLTPVGQE